MLKAAGKLALANWYKYTQLTRIKLVYIEVTSKCNLLCQNCSRTDNEYPSKNINMSLTLFKSIVDSIPNKIKSLCPQGIGESTMNPDFTSMIKYASESKKFDAIFFNSNALFLDMAKYQEFYDNGLTGFSISVDSLKEDVVQKLRKGTRVKKLIKNLKEAVALYKDNLEIRMVVSKINLEDLEFSISNLIDIGIRKIEIQNLVEYNNPNVCLDAEQILFVKRLIKKYQRLIKIKFIHTVKGCTQPFDTLVINVEGNVSACCLWFDDNIISFGNITDGMDNSFYSNKFVDFRKKFYKKMPGFCKICPDYKQL